MLLLHPVVVWALLFKFDLEFFWFLKDNYKLFDLLYSAVSFIVFSSSLWLLASKARIYIILIFWMMFVFYQTAIWGFSNNRYLSKVELSSGVSLALIRYDFGALSSDNFVKLEKFERKFVFFVARTELKQFSNVKYANVNYSEDLLSIEITYYGNSKDVEHIKLKDI